MKTDADLLRELDGRSAPGTVVRFYAWARPTLSLGRNQKAGEAADLEFCESAGVDVVHRPTGGQAVLHDDEITYAVISNEPEAFDGGSVYGVYRRISEGLAEGYRRLGVDVTLAPGNGTRHSRGGGRGNDPCFVAQSRYELTVGGRKILGSAQRRLRRAFLQHGSMPLSLDRELLARATRFRNAAMLGEMAALGEYIDPIPGRDELVGVFGRALGDYFGVELVPERL